MKKPAKIGKRVNLTVRRTPTTSTPRTPKFSHTKYLGQEPATDLVVTEEADGRLVGAMNWYNYFFDTDECKEWLVKYMADNTSQYTPTQVRLIKGAATWRLPRTIGTICHLMNDRGWTLPEGIRTRNTKRIVSILKELGDEVAADPRATSNPQERVLARAKVLAYGMLDEHIDLFYEDHTYRAPLYDVLQDQKPSPQACNMMTDKVAEHLAELSEEGYSHLPARTIKAYRTFFDALQEDIDRFSTNKKAARPRKVRAIKTKPTEKIVEKVQYLKEFAPLKLVSIPPTQIVKAKSLWVYNAKYKQLTVFHSLDDNGLGIKGTTITNFNPDTSVTKRLGRKVEATLQSVLTSGKIAIRKIMSEDLKATSAMVAKGRLNENSILLRAITT